MTRKSTFDPVAAVLILFMLVLSCRKDVSKPEYANPYDEKSQAYVATPGLSTVEVTQITGTSARSGGIFQNNFGKPASAKGVCWSTSQNPTTSSSCTSDGASTTNYVSNITGLAMGTTYYVRAYATNEAGTTYGGQRTFTTPQLAVVTTGSVSSITSTSATVSATVTSDGGSSVTARGVCVSTSQNPTTSDNCNSSGSGIGSYSVNLTSLSGATTYYARAYVITATGTGYGGQISFTTLAGLATVTTGSVTNISNSGATVAGNVTATGGTTVTGRGVCYATTQNPTISGTCVASGSGTGTFSATITGLSAGVTYFVRAYATNSAGTAYGSQESFSATAGLPSLTTGSITNISSTGATVAGNVTATGGTTVTARGICYATTQNPTISGTCVASGSGTGTFTGTITGLSPGVTYFVRAYATNSAGTAYGSQASFTTNAILPTVTTGSVTNINSSGATVAGSVTATGGATVTSRGVCYATTQNPTISGTCVASGSGTGAFSATITGLSGTVSYFVRAYATNSAGTAYGTQTTFMTTAALPTVAAVSIELISSSGARLASEVSATGGATVTSRGVCYSTTQNPTISGTCVASGSGAGIFSATITGLPNTTTYYVRAYATNSAGTAYGTQILFTTLTSVNDIDGNVYPTVQIGAQVWMEANLRTSRYRNGDAIPNVTNSVTWEGLTTGAWAHYDNNTANETVYGKLYNGYAVADTRNICPTGWNVPSETEWALLTNFLGTSAGRKMRATSGWYNNGHGTNSSGFNGLPGGSRPHVDSFYIVGRAGYFWSTSASPQYDPGKTTALYLYYSSSEILKSHFNKSYGFSVRCLRD